jgi:tRNA nucleotidyltransferase (CCA-adding enzyme)
VRTRGTTPVAVTFDAPDLLDDELYPQLRKSLAGIGDALARRGFAVLRREAFADDRAVLFFELAVAELPAVERHQGPPVHVRGHTERFLAGCRGCPADLGEHVYEYI